MAPPAKPTRQEKLGVNPLVIVTALVVVVLGCVFIWLALEARSDAEAMIGSEPAAVRTVEAPEHAPEPTEPEPVALRRQEPDPDVAAEPEAAPVPADEHETTPPDARSDTVLTDSGTSAGVPATTVEAGAQADAGPETEAATGLDTDADADASAAAGPVAEEGEAEGMEEPAAVVADGMVEDETVPRTTSEVEMLLADILDGADNETPDEAISADSGGPAAEPVEAVDEPPESSGSPLAPPDGSLLETTRHGELPVIAADGREAWQVYARPFPPGDARPRVAVVLTGLGLSQAATNAAIGLPGAISLSFAPYAANLNEWASRARAAGHEILLDLPMEPQDYPTDDPGPHTLLTSLNPSDNVARLEWLLGRFAGYIGVIDRTGTKFTRSSKALRPVLATLKNRGLMVVDSRTSETSRVFDLAGQVGLARAMASAVIDRLASRDAIDRQLAVIEQEARASGYAVAVARPYPVTIERLSLWARSLEDRGFVLAPVSAIANRQSADPP